jgi:hypothetical protein
MCNLSNCSHDALNDDLGDIFGGVVYDGPAPVAFAKAALSNATSVITYEEDCDKCNGTGRFVGYTGRVLGNCFTCKGKGTRQYKTSSEQRAKARDAAAAKRATEAANSALAAIAWLEANPVEGEWLREGVARGFEFAVSMRDALVKYGSFTERQEAAVRSAAAKSAARKAQWAAEKAEREAGAAVLSMDKIRSGFESAVRYLKRPKLRIANVQFSLAPATARNGGCIYVVRAEDDTYLGKITPEDKFLRSRDCTDADAEVVARVASDPAAAAEAHGHEFGQCSCCGRELTNPESVARGIGPICADRWGW